MIGDTMKQIIVTLTIEDSAANWLANEVAASLRQSIFKLVKRIEAKKDIGIEVKIEG